MTVILRFLISPKRRKHVLSRKSSSKSSASGKAPSKKSNVSGENEVLELLKQIRTEQTKTIDRVDNMNKRIDALYQDDEYEYEDNNEDYCQFEDDEACDEVQADERTPRHLWGTTQ